MIISYSVYAKDFFMFLFFILFTKVFHRFFLVFSTRIFFKCWQQNFFYFHFFYSVFSAIKIKKNERKFPCLNTLENSSQLFARKFILLMMKTENKYKFNSPVKNFPFVLWKKKKKENVEMESVRWIMEKVNETYWKGNCASLNIWWRCKTK